MEQIRNNPVGGLLLVLVATGLIALAVWQIASAFLAADPPRRRSGGSASSSSASPSPTSWSRACPHLRAGWQRRLGDGVEDPQLRGAFRSGRRRPARRHRTVGGRRGDRLRRGRLHARLREAARSADGSRTRWHRDARGDRLLRQGHRGGRDRRAVRGRRGHAGSGEGRGARCRAPQSAGAASRGTRPGAVGAGFAIYGVFCIARARFARM